MTINEIELTIPEMKEAATQWLLAQGLNVEVTNVETNGYPVRGYTITCQPKKQTVAETVIPGGSGDLQ
jgi:hypothetical protein